MADARRSGGRRPAATSQANTGKPPTLGLMAIAWVIAAWRFSMALLFVEFMILLRNASLTSPVPSVHSAPADLAVEAPARHESLSCLPAWWRCVRGAPTRRRAPHGRRYA